MTRSIHRLRFAALVALAIPFTAGAALAQDRSGGFLDNIFNRGDQGDQGQQAAPPQGGGSDIAMRLDRIENSLRELTGNIEQLQYRNQQLETQVRELQQRAGIAPAAAPQGGGPGTLMPQGPAPQQGMPQRGTPQQAMPPANASPGSDRRSDAFDPSRHPNAPGAPRVLGTETASAGPAGAQPVGAPGGREAGAPLDLSSMSGSPPATPATANAAPGQLPPPPPVNPSATGAQLATLPPSGQPQDEYDLAYGYVLHKDYGLATQAFRDFIRKYPNEKLIPDAQYWMGEALYQQQRYRDAAEAFLTVSTKYERAGKAPDALLRLGQSLAALKKKEAACATLAEVGRKYPHASASVKRGVAQEQKRVHC